MVVVIKGVQSKMKYIQQQQDLFTVDFSKYIPVHCIASDCAMGAGIAVPMAQKFHLRSLTSLSPETLKHPTCVLFHKVYNLITKKHSSGKPTMRALEMALQHMKVQIQRNETKYIVMPQIGSGLDRLSWPEIREYIKDLFKDVDVEILVCIWG